MVKHCICCDEDVAIQGVVNTKDIPFLCLSCFNTSKGQELIKHYLKDLGILDGSQERVVGKSQRLNVVNTPSSFGMAGAPSARRTSARVLAHWYTT